MRRERDVRGIVPRFGRWTRLVTMSMVLCTLALAAACRSNTKEDEAPAPVPPTYLTVENRAFLDMTIYVYQSSQRLRLGIATGNTDTRMIIPAHLLFGATPLRFQADPIGGSRQPTSEEVVVSPGDEVVLAIPPR